MKFQKILIIRLSSIGDIVLSTPLLRAVRNKFPEASIHFAVKKEFVQLLRYNPHVDELIVVDSANMSTSLQQIRKENYDWVIDIHQSSRSYQLRSAAKNALITSYPKNRLKRSLLIRLKWNLYKTIEPVYQRYFKAVEKFNITDDGKGTEVFVSDAEEKKINDILLPTHVNNRPLVAICPGAKFANKRWTKEGFIEISQKLQQTHGACIAILGGPGEEGLCEEIKASIGADAINLAGKLSLLESAVVLKRSKLVLVNDSGMLHLAQSQKTPVVAIFGPTVKEFGFFPLENKSTVIETTISCRPCTKMGLDKCPKGHHKCMVDISANQVYQATEEYLK